MKTFKPAQIMSTVLLLAAGLLTPQKSIAQTTCRQTLATDARAIAADLSAIAAQANAQGFNTAVEQLATDMEPILPTLTRPSQVAVQKFVTDLETAVSASSPGGSTITPAERLVLTNDWVILVTSTGATSTEITTISNDLTAALSILKGISAAQLQADLNTLIVNAQACRARTLEIRADQWRHR